MWIKTVIYAVLAVTISTLSVTTAMQSRHLKDVRNQVAEQSRVIDSLLTIRHNWMNVDLHVTDKSVSKVYGSYNRGSITMPSVRTYKLQIDSCSFKIKEP